MIYQNGENEYFRKLYTKNQALENTLAVISYFPKK